MGARRSAEVRKAKAEERRKTLEDLLAEKLEAHADEVVACFLANIREGDWRAADAFVTRVYGRPVEKVEATTERIEGLSLDELRALRARLLDRYPELRAVE